MLPKRVALLLNNVIQQYEEKFGEISLESETAPPPQQTAAEPTGKPN